MNAERVLEILAKDAGTTLDHVLSLVDDPDGEPNERSRIHDWRNYISPSSLLKMGQEQAVAELIIAHRKANDEEWD